MMSDNYMAAVPLSNSACSQSGMHFVHFVRSDLLCKDNVSMVWLRRPSVICAADAQGRLGEEVRRRQQAERQLLELQHGYLPATSSQGSPPPHNSHQVGLIIPNKP